MAAVDYYSCDVCGGKTFYDVSIHYNDNHTFNCKQIPVGAAAMYVLCQKCEHDYKLVVERKGKEL